MARGVPKPNYTQAPNVLLDELLPEIKTLGELKVTLVVVRETIGWHEEERKLSLAELERRTGLSRQGVIDGAKAAVARGTVERRVEGVRGAQEVFYALNLASQESGLGLVNDLDQDQSTDWTSSSQESGPGPIEGKESSKETPPSPLASEGDREKWERVLVDLASINMEHTFHVWLKPIRLLAREGDTLVLGVPSEQASWIRERFLKMIEEAAARVFGASVTVELPESEIEREGRMRRELSERRPAPRRRRRRTA